MAYTTNPPKRHHGQPTLLSQVRFSPKSNSTAWLPCWAYPADPKSDFTKSKSTPCLPCRAYPAERPSTPWLPCRVYPAEPNSISPRPNHWPGYPAEGQSHAQATLLGLPCRSNASITPTQGRSTSAYPAERSWDGFCLCGGEKNRIFFLRARPIKKVAGTSEGLPTLLRPPSLFGGPGPTGALTPADPSAPRGPFRPLTPRLPQCPRLPQYPQIARRVSVD